MAALKDTDLRYVWHPFTQMRDFEPDEALVMVRGRGNYLYDEDGNRYFDATSSLWVNVHGHAHPGLNAALRRQVGRLAHSTLLGLGNEPSALLAEQLVEMAGGRLARVFYSDNGSTAVEVALKMAFQYHRHRGATGTRRSRFVSLSNGYHGDTVGAVSVGGMELFHSIFSPLLFHTYLAPSPSCHRCPFGLAHPGCGLACVTAMEELLDDKGDEIAAVVVEPLVQGAGGMVIYPPEVLKGYEQAARSRGVFLIVDEVATGFGRTGTMFACEQAGVQPDFMTVAKGLTGGYLPVAATLVSNEVYESFLADWKEFRAFFHGHTYTGNPLGCAAALANLELVRRPGFLDRVRGTGEHLEACARERLGENPFVGSIRTLGMMGGIELVADRATGKSLPGRDRTGHRVCLEARRAGVLARPLGDVIVLMPPLSSSLGEVAHLVEALAWGIDRVLGKSGGSPPRFEVRCSPETGVMGEATAVVRVSGPTRVLVTGTDTGVGKTVVTACLAAALAQLPTQGVLCYKPVETGVPAVRKDGDGSDGALLGRVSTARHDLPEFRLLRPLSPNIAARLDGMPVDFEAVASSIRHFADEGTVLLVEGAGGFLVPVTDQLTFADLAAEAELSVILVVGDKLGCINHTLLSVRAINDMGLCLAAVVVHPFQPGPADGSSLHNVAELRRILSDSVVLQIPYVDNLTDMAALARAGASAVATIWAP